MLYGYIDGRVVRVTGDGPDADRLPDSVPADATIVFYPITQTLVDDGAVPGIGWAEPVRAHLDADGLLRDQQEHRGVYVLQGQHVVEITSPSRRRPQVFPITVTADHTESTPLYLARAMELTPSPAQVFVVNEQILDEVQDARDRAEAAALAAGAVLDPGAANRFRFVIAPDEARATWTLHHGLGRLPADVALYPDGSNGERVFTTYNSTEQDTTITWPEPTSGLAVIEP